MKKVKRKCKWQACNKKQIAEIYAAGFIPDEIFYLINKKQRGAAKIIRSMFFLSYDDAKAYLEHELPVEWRSITEVRAGLLL